MVQNLQFHTAHEQHPLVNDTVVTVDQSGSLSRSIFTVYIQPDTASYLPWLGRRMTFILLGSDHIRLATMS